MSDANHVMRADPDLRRYAHLLVSDLLLLSQTINRVSRHVYRGTRNRAITKSASSERTTGDTSRTMSDADMRQSNDNKGSHVCVLTAMERRGR